MRARREQRRTETKITKRPLIPRCWSSIDKYTERAKMLLIQLGARESPRCHTSCKLSSPTGSCGGLYSSATDMPDGNGTMMEKQAAETSV